MPSEETLRTIANRRSIRQFKSTPVDREVILKLLRAGMAAPTAGNRQPWEFIVITDRATMDRIAEMHPFAKMLHHAPLCISVCGDVRRAYESAPEYWVQDCSAATENILLAAEALGLGAVWCGIYPQASRVESLRRLLGLPHHVVPLNVLAIGYPNEDPPVKDKWREDRVHWQRW